MAFQSSVFLQQGAGVVGEFFDDGPHRAQPFSIFSGDASNNVIGRAVTLTSEGVVAAGGTNLYKGILVCPKDYALYGTQAGGTLAPTLTVANNTLIQACTMGSIWVTLPSPAAIGDLVIYENTTGILSTIAPGDTIDAGYSFAFAVVDRFTVTVAGLAVITLTPTLVIPEPTP